jgi:RNA polymerase-binding transcription factor DksA
VNGADSLDAASELTQQRTDDAIREATYRVRPQQVQNLDGTWPHPDCDDCGNEIPMARLQMGRIRCVYCQERLEKRVGR